MGTELDPMRVAKAAPTVQVWARAMAAQESGTCRAKASRLMASDAPESASTRLMKLCDIPRPKGARVIEV